MYFSLKFPSVFLLCGKETRILTFKQNHTVNLQYSCYMLCEKGNSHVILLYLHCQLNNVLYFVSKLWSTFRWVFKNELSSAHFICCGHSPQISVPDFHQLRRKLYIMLSHLFDHLSFIPDIFHIPVMAVLDCGQSLFKNKNKSAKCNRLLPANFCIDIYVVYVYSTTFCTSFSFQWNDMS